MGAPTVGTGKLALFIAITADGKSAYVTSAGANAVWQYDINRASGALSSKSPAHVAAKSAPFGIAVTPEADLSVKVSAPRAAKRGSDVTYAITVSNAGPSRAWHVRLADQLPAGARFMSASTTRGGCTVTKRETGGTMHCQLGTLGSGQSAGSQRIRVRVLIASKRHVIEDVAKVASVTPDPSEADNTARVRTQVHR
jgi:uncharacterized repeat protein (TIGR01451 family)